MKEATANLETRTPQCCSCKTSDGLKLPMLRFILNMQHCESYWHERVASSMVSFARERVQMINGIKPVLVPAALTALYIKYETDDRWFVVCLRCQLNTKKVRIKRDTEKAFAGSLSKYVSFMFSWHHKQSCKTMHAVGKAHSLGSV